MKEQGWTPQDNVIYKEGEYLWSPQICVTMEYELIRSYYYTSVCGDEGKLQTVRETIKKIRTAPFGRPGREDYLYPRLFKKERN